MLRLNVIIASTRPGRVGSTVGTWFYELARHHGNFDVRWVDLVDFNLPVFDEPYHPRQQNYQHEHTKRWAASVDEADAYVFVVPEYNFGPTPALLNALNYVYHEWNYKPAAFVSYGGISGGMRSVEATKPTQQFLRLDCCDNADFGRAGHRWALGGQRPHESFPKIYTGLGLEYGYRL